MCIQLARDMCLNIRRFSSSSSLVLGKQILLLLCHNGTSFKEIHGQLRICQILLTHALLTKQMFIQYTQCRNTCAHSRNFGLSPVLCLISLRKSVVLRGKREN